MICALVRASSSDPAKPSSPDARTCRVIDIVDISSVPAISAVPDHSKQSRPNKTADGKRPGASLLNKVIMSVMPGPSRSSASPASLLPAASADIMKAHEQAAATAVAALPPSDVEDESDEGGEEVLLEDAQRDTNLVLQMEDGDDNDGSNGAGKKRWDRFLFIKTPSARSKTSTSSSVSSIRRSTSGMRRAAGSRRKSRSSSSRTRSLAQQIKTSAKATLILALVVVVLVVLVLTIIPDSPIRGMLLDFLLWIRGIDPLLASVIVTFLYVASLMLCAPVTPLNLASGFLFQLWLGSAVSIIGCMLGSLFAFLAGRFMVRDWVAGWARDNPRFRAIDKAVENEGFKLVVLVRLSPILPFPLLNFFFGATKISLLNYSLGTLIGITPFTCIYTYFGSILRELSDIWQENTQDLLTRFAWIIVTVITTVATVVFVMVLTKRALRRAMKDYVTSTTDVFDDDSLFDLERFAASAASKEAATISDKQSNLSDDDSDQPSPDSAMRRAPLELGDIIIDNSVSIDLTTNTTDRSRPFHM